MQDNHESSENKRTGIGAILNLDPSQKDDAYTFKFMALVCLACAIVVSAAATVLKSLQVENEKIDVQRNILGVMGLAEKDATLSSSQVSELYSKSVKCILVDQNGEVIDDDADPTSVNLEEQEKAYRELSLRNPEAAEKMQLRYPLFVTPREEPYKIYCIPISGKGLWSTLYGYLALESDANTVAGITFYKHGETPGLGGEIENPNWQEQFEGKQILNEQQELVSITVVKGKAPEGDEHAVDGLSGATLTCRGVENLLLKDLQHYLPYFKKVWEQKGN